MYELYWYCTSETSGKRVCIYCQKTQRDECLVEGHTVTGGTSVCTGTAE